MSIVSLFAAVVTACLLVAPASVSAVDTISRHVIDSSDNNNNNSSDSFNASKSLHATTTTSCKTDSDCGPHSRCDVDQGFCVCVEGTVPVVSSAVGGQGSVGCRLQARGIGDECDTDDECRHADLGLTCDDATKKCVCAPGFTLHDRGDTCIQEVSSSDEEHAHQNLTSVLPTTTEENEVPKAEQIFNPDERTRRRLQNASNEFLLSPALTAVVVVSAAVLISALCIATYVKCRTSSTSNSTSSSSIRRGTYAASSSSSDAFNASNSSFGGSSGIAKKLKFWSRHQPSEPRLTISVLGQIYEKEWSLHSSKSAFNRKEFDEDNGEQGNPGNEYVSDIAYYIQEETTVVECNTRAAGQQENDEEGQDEVPDAWQCGRTQV